MIHPAANRSLVVAIVLLVQCAVGVLHADAAETSAELERGESLLKSKGCIGCHSADGSTRVGPTFVRMWRHKLQVHIDGVPGEILMDRDAFITALERPEQVLVDGYPSGVMPPAEFDDDELEAAEAYLESLAGSEEEERAGRFAMLSVAFASFVFAFLHLFLSSTAIRAPMIGKVGLNPFLGIYSVLVAAALTWLIWAWIVAPFQPLWAPVRWTRWIPLMVMPISILMMVAGFSLKNPASFGQESQLDSPDAVIGILKITRHPGLWGQGLWALAHIPPNGDLASLMFFSSFAFLSFAGMLHIDQRRKLAFGSRWEAFTSRTSLLPFGVVVRDGIKVSLADIGYVNILISLLLYSGFLYVHVWVIGVSPLP
jgi:uncharacterized membrane protein/mono/diheme cytochrome c family protein|tara:strand:+ start:5798 stop:6907 length:1110 start_codon:yes stop_codon:yes gene_type:complete